MLLHKTPEYLKTMKAEFKLRYWTKSRKAEFIDTSRAQSRGAKGTLVGSKIWDSSYYRSGSFNQGISRTYNNKEPVIYWGSRHT